MSIREHVDFSLQLACIFTVYYRVVRKYIHQRTTLSFNAFVTALSLNADHSGMSARAIADYLGIKPRSAWSMLIEMENAGIIAKTVDSNDGRIMLVTLTDKGVEQIAEWLNDVNRWTQNIFWSDFPNKEFDLQYRQFIWESTKRLRGFSVDEYVQQSQGDSVGSSGFMAELLLFHRLLIEDWNRVVSQKCNLSFSEYLVLALLEKKGSLHPCDIADFLMTGRSAITAHVSTLLSEGLVEKRFDDQDRRAHSLQATTKGRRLSRGITGDLDKRTSWIYGPTPDNRSTLFNSYYLRMYSNLRRQCLELDQLVMPTELPSSNFKEDTQF